MILMYNVWVLAGIWSFMIKQSSCLLETENYMQQIWQIFGPKIGRLHLRTACSHRHIFDTVKLPSLNKMVICKVVAYRRWSLTRSGHCEQEGILYAHASIWAVEVPQKHFLWIVYVQYQHLQAVFWSWMTCIGCYVPQTCSLRYQGISTMKASLL